MRRFRDYLRFLAWQSGLSYIALWALTFWTLDAGPAVFGNAGCHADEAKVLFYWVCDPASPFSILASLANTALTATVWAPVYFAAATMRPDAVAIAGPIVLTHAIGLPTAIFVVMRLMLALFQVPRRFVHSRDDGSAAIPRLQAPMPQGARRWKTVKPRSNFGLRGALPQ